MIARRLQVGTKFTVPPGALKYAGALVRVKARSYQTWGGEPFVAVEFEGVDIPEIGGSISFAPSAEVDSQE